MGSRIYLKVKKLGRTPTVVGAKLQLVGMNKPRVCLVHEGERFGEISLGDPDGFMKLLNEVPYTLSPYDPERQLDSRGQPVEEGYAVFELEADLAGASIERMRSMVQQMWQEQPGQPEDSANKWHTKLQGGESFTPGSLARRRKKS